MLLAHGAAAAAAAAAVFLLPTQLLAWRQQSQIPQHAK
jgi:hypothetical protein